MRTIVYIDGYNFYYGLLKNTSYKWLDIVSLMKRICHAQKPSSEITSVKFFTSPVITRVATNGNKSLQAQESYHKALKSKHQILEIIKGYHTLEEAYLPIYKKPIDKNARTKVWRLEEKQTDVNIALHMYRDVVQGKCEQVVLVSSDSDLSPSLEFIRRDINDFQIGLILPRKQPVENERSRPPNAKLSQLSDWTRSYIRNDELELFQLPDKVSTRKKPAIKPDYW